MSKPLYSICVAQLVSDQLDLMHSIAEQHDGEYDGWEASIET